MNPLKSDEYPAIYADYIENVVGSVIDELQEQLTTFPAFIRGIPADRGDFTYAEGKWTVKEVLCHILDTERVMAYRALRFARNDMTELAAFEQDEFVQHARHNERSFEHIAEEFIALRQSNLLLFDTFNETELARKGMASGRLVTVKAFMYVIAGHLTHHRIILKERYLSNENIEHVENLV
ncbi:DinB family protein [Sphingobacterium griseoflavum]|uniref:DNA damage-inducible protein DinB n=1 Tax=Sphingobacterium griseoflavum TaxID=1474952 RepID=A0ABQ3HWF6_9SPHI|nr:DinB family protein [Sphingobacterium griseoflavum]GHE40502.1 DNA damage-inducible protein DinB [Sphingobacterium griseoflavum]